MKTFLLIFLFLSFLFQSGSCYQHNKKNDEWKEIRGPNQMTNLVVFFKKGTTNDESNLFWKERLKIQEYEIASLLYLNENGYDGVGINFSTNATIEQKKQLKKSIQESSIVYKVFENVVPSQAAKNLE